MTERRWQGFKLVTSWRRQAWLAWVQDSTLVRWGLPSAVVALGLSLGWFGFRADPSLTDVQAQLDLVREQHSLQETRWLSESALREQVPALQASYLAWQTSLRWNQASPWLQWPKQAKDFGLTVHRIQPVSVQSTADLVQHKITLEGVGDLADVDAWWRELGRQGWWVTLHSMRMQASRTSLSTWQAQWLVHEGLPADAPVGSAPVKGEFMKAKWAQSWLIEGGPSLAQGHASVSVAPSVKWTGGGTLASPSEDSPNLGGTPLPWPKTEWTHMRLVGRWMRGQQVVALVAVGDVVHAVAPGMRLGPQQHEVVQVTWDGVWVLPGLGGGRPKRVLRWADDPAGAPS
jgi:hypothetical protein